ncbi:hypothetical protein, partial [Xanthomonas cannabis]|uniref:hypothetical protein n=1 Tax=Xanthomonas cannabis TaxID=1885674 RepID=UPI00194ED2BD
MAARSHVRLYHSSAANKESAPQAVRFLAGNQGAKTLDSLDTPSSWIDITPHRNASGRTLLR